MEQRSANSQVRGSPDYAVCLLEDDASLWPEVHALLPDRAAVERADCDANAIGLLGWDDEHLLYPADQVPARIECLGANEFCGVDHS